ncbi:acetyltransferase, GNAT family [Trichinella nativa]|uniref:N-terminal methionine N(alpha)-acetyltransferase NatE n=1 Tax=Trichinella nativa TaxID=6335 RepID=A0A1Y3EVU3_9BILA|nr:acetyltransferase, GNAT family [Trichinella nativa]
MDLVVKAIDHNQDGFVDLAEFLHALSVDSEMITDDKKISKEIEMQLNLCSCKEKYPVEEVRPGRCGSQVVWLFRRRNVKPEKVGKLSSSTSYGPLTKIRENTKRSIPMCSTNAVASGASSLVTDNICKTSPIEASTAHDTGHHTPQRINGIVFPVNYNARFYEDVLSTTNIAKFAYFNDIVVGAMCCRILLVNNEKKLYIMTLGCLPNYRRFGLGTMMLEHVFDYCRKNSSISGIFLHVQVNNDVALEFYRKFGFEVHSVVENYYKRITPADAFLLVKRLDGARRNDNVKEV